MWVFDSPLSYWDRDAHAGMIVSLILCGVMWFRFQTWLAPDATIAAAATQLAPVYIWVFVFDSKRSGPKNKKRARFGHVF